MSAIPGRTRYTTLHRARDGADRRAIRVFTTIRAVVLLAVLVVVIAALADR